VGLSDELKAISESIPKKIENIKTEEATKNALIIPFIEALGYDMKDPLEVVPEFTADLDAKKGKKVDYAIMKDGEPIILMECKPCYSDLDKEHKDQLCLYFMTTSTRFGILTNGVTYQFYTDIEKANIMDLKPFFEVDLTNLMDFQIEELKKFTKEEFDKIKILKNASDLKFTNQMKKVMSKELSEPSDEFVKFFTKKVYPGPVTEKIRLRFRDITENALKDIIKDKVNTKLKKAIIKTEEVDEVKTEVPNVIVKPPKEIVTTVDEWEGYYIIKTILHELIDPERVILRDKLSYCGILLDNNRKPIARLRFNTKQKHLGLFDNNREEEKIPIDSVNDIYKYAVRLKDTIGFYENIHMKDKLKRSDRFTWEEGDIHLVKKGNSANVATKASENENK
jgi:Uncharacterized conserved protein